LDSISSAAWRNHEIGARPGLDFAFGFGGLGSLELELELELSMAATACTCTWDATMGFLSSTTSARIGDLNALDS
jgi:hypothetical protein